MSLDASTAEFLADARHLQVAGQDVELIVKGSGAPLLFLHGMDGVEKAAPLIDRLARDFTVYAPSHPGFGASALPAHYTHIDDLAYFTLDLLDALALQRPVIAGFSFGGWLAAEVLVKDPTRASRLVLGAPLGLPTADRRTQHVTDIFMLGAGELQARMQVSPPPAPVDVASIPEAMLERSVRNAEAVALFGWSPYLHNPKLRHRLHRIAAPTLLLWGEDDRIAPQSYGRGFVEALPNVEFRTFGQCGHRIHIDQPEAAADAIRAFAGATIEEPAK
ncbi:MAG: alpha/beta fold hydrolase [Novosphingobium sp.]|nr:alpha/beta fold hydrolase [Novosphingobium sp.]